MHAFNNRVVFAILAILVIMLVGLPAVGLAKDADYRLAITKQGFQPQALSIPAGKRVKVMVHNKLALPAEFESYDFTVEKVVPGGTTVPVYIGPLKKGHYKFFNDFAQNMQGKLTVR
ncbi:cupredoxin domain-containing protein [Salinisphaera sp. LB1]|uniref:cupredoxin domain-containing protein n=1 Tax=Salinisphaera sp. LB1 TaxID=2183911 RepID=UPI000D70625C|nr:cupredoxin domain-containing protein [Salinisphaera sp. LB1]AWN14454.1 Heme/copper-type cytochrome/quinol oxidase, subunit 2 [Salinisphaera sp. LB1]